MENLIRTNIKIIHNKEDNHLEVAFSGFISYEELVEICEYEFQLIEYYKIKKCLINLREIHIYPPGGEEFIKTGWFPKIIELEVKAVAFVVPDDVFAKISMKEAHDIEAIPVAVQHFTHEGAANQWFQSILVHDDHNNHHEVGVRSI